MTGRDYILGYRDSLLQQYRDAGLSGDDYAVVAAMTLGDRTALTREVRDTYNASGASHILALSGLHMSIIYILLTTIVPSRRWRMVSQLLTIAAIWAFALLTGLSPSIVRAAIMLTIYGLLSLGYREKASIRILLFTAVLMLLFNPRLIYSVSFQLSYTAVLGILLFMPMLYGLIPPHILQRRTLLKWVWGMVTVSTSAQIGVAPLIAFYFHRLPVWFLLSNFIVVPCAYIILIGGLLLLVTHISLFATLLSTTVGLMNNTLQHIASLPCASIPNLYPTWLQVVLIYVVIACVYIFFRIYARQSRRITI